MTKIIIEIEGGCVSNLTANLPTKICIIDWDAASENPNPPFFERWRNLPPHSFDKFLKELKEGLAKRYAEAHPEEDITPDEEVPW